MPLNPNDIRSDNTIGKRPNPNDIESRFADPWKNVSSIGDDLKKISEGKAFTTVKNIAQILPAFDFAANLATSTYGVPISGLIGIAALPFGADAANNAIQAVQKFLVYQPQTPGGQQLQDAAAYPNKKLSELGEWVGGKTENPLVSSISKSLIEGAPAIAGIFTGTPKVSSAGKFTTTVEQGINKGVRPSVIKKEFWSQRQKYMENATLAVDEIINNKNNLKLIDKDGESISGRTPQSLNEFSQALEQTKRKIFEQYDELSQTADNRGASVNMGPILNELDGVINDRVMQTMSPGTVEYAKSRIAALRESSVKGGPQPSPKTFSTKETQSMVQMLNQSEKAFYANPTPEMMGRAYVDSMIANNLRAGLDAAIEGATGIEYQPLKRTYGALRMLETDVTKRAIVDARKNTKGLLDFSDLFSSSQIVQGLMSQQGSILAAGLAVRGTKAWYKFVNDPNKIVSKMFQKSEKFKIVPDEAGIKLTPNLVYGSTTGEYKGE